mgnify:CR=1 FL=1
MNVEMSTKIWPVPIAALAITKQSQIQFPTEFLRTNSIAHLHILCMYSSLEKEVETHIINRPIKTIIMTVSPNA